MSLRKLQFIRPDEAQACETLFNQLCVTVDVPERRAELARMVVGAYYWPDDVAAEAIQILMSSARRNDDEIGLEPSRRDARFGVLGQGKSIHATHPEGDRGTSRLYRED